MSGLPTITGEFRLADDPTLRFTPNGAAVCEFRAVAQERRFNKDTNQWEDAASCWVKVTCWKDLAEHAAETLEKGKLAVVSGQLLVEQWEDDKGNKRLTVVIRAQYVGPSLTFDVAKIGAPAPKQQQGGGGGQQPAGDEPPF